MPTELSTELRSQIESLEKLGLAQLMAISEDFSHPDEVLNAARALAEKLAQSKLEAAAGVFQENTAAFAGLVTDFVDLTTIARKHPGGDAVALLTPTLRKLGEIQATLSNFAVEVAPSAGITVADPEVPVAHVKAAAGAPAPNTASTSKSLKDIASEYLATFDAAVVAPARVAEADRRAKTLASFRSTYEPLGLTVNVPWYFIGLIHCMESNFNFGTHLHNGDSLMHRTSHVPAGRPLSDVADPPFSWVTSATDALTMLGLNTQSDWSLAAILYRLERYNGFGYRIRGLATPYLWSFSDRYSSGKFVQDGVFSFEVVSKQCGAAVVLKRLIALGIVQRP